MAVKANFAFIERNCNTTNNNNTITTTTTNNNNSRGEGATVLCLYGNLCSPLLIIPRDLLNVQSMSLF